MQTKIAFILKENLNDKKGLFWAAFNRMRIFQDNNPEFKVDCYNIQFYYNWITRKLNKIDNLQNTNSIQVQGRTINIIWIRIPFFQIVLQKLGIKSSSTVEKELLLKASKKFILCDLVSAHSRHAAIFAKGVSEKQHIPFFVTWHGTDIHTAPLLNNEIRNITKQILQDASCNFFVSDDLRNQAYKITHEFKSEILYNGISDSFHRFSETKRFELRKHFNVSGKKVITFCGNLIPIKNVLVLPEIFSNIQKKTKLPCQFWIIGDGVLHKELDALLNNSQLEYRFWGNLPNTEIPTMFNSTDILIVPSKKEGFSLVCLEAIYCGANVVGSNTGAIPEIIGLENCFKLEHSFVENISSRAAEILESPILQLPKEVFNWDVTCKKEAYIYTQYSLCQ